MSIKKLSTQELKDLEEKILIDLCENPENGSVKQKLNEVQAKLAKNGYERNRLLEDRYDLIKDQYENY